jgi:glucose-1-phosphate cytidylyltransferase
MGVAARGLTMEYRVAAGSQLETDMKAVLLAGGLGTRISEESVLRPKPMIEIGGRPILWHILKIYANHGIRDFIICLGYKSYIVKEYFANYMLHSSNITLDTRSGQLDYHDSNVDDWHITLVDTGEETMTGGRLKRVGKYLTPGEPFCLTYGDGVSDVDITKLVEFHKLHGKEATVTAVTPPGRYGALDISDGMVNKFIEKPIGDNGMINGGFFVLQPEVLDRIEGDSTSWEHAPLESLARDKQLMAYRHHGFWQPMDTLRDKVHLEQLWQSGNAPWKSW